MGGERTSWPLLHCLACLLNLSFLKAGIKIMSLLSFSTLHNPPPFPSKLCPPLLELRYRSSTVPDWDLVSTSDCPTGSDTLVWCVLLAWSQEAGADYLPWQSELILRGKPYTSSLPVSPENHTILYLNASSDIIGPRICRLLTLPFLLPRLDLISHLYKGTLIYALSLPIPLPSFYSGVSPLATVLCQSNAWFLPPCPETAGWCWGEITQPHWTGFMIYLWAPSLSQTVSIAQSALSYISLPSFQWLPLTYLTALSPPSPLSLECVPR